MAIKTLSGSLRTRLLRRNTHLEPEPIVRIPVPLHLDQLRHAALVVLGERNVAVHEIDEGAVSVRRHVLAKTLDPFDAGSVELWSVRLPPGLVLQQNGAISKREGTVVAVVGNHAAEAVEAQVLTRAGYRA